MSVNPFVSKMFDQLKDLNCSPDMKKFKRRKHDKLIEDVSEQLRNNFSCFPQEEEEEKILTKDIVIVDKNTTDVHIKSRGGNLKETGTPHSAYSCYQACVAVYKENKNSIQKKIPSDYTYISHHSIHFEKVKIVVDWRILVLQKKSTKDYLVAVKGTTLNFSDLIADIAILTEYNLYYAFLEAYVLFVRTVVGNLDHKFRITLTGHSLGASVVDLSSQAMKLKAIGFNPGATRRSSLGKFFICEGDPISLKTFKRTDDVQFYYISSDHHISTPAGLFGKHSSSINAQQFKNIEKGNPKYKHQQSKKRKYSSDDEPFHKKRKRNNTLPPVKIPSPRVKIPLPPVIIPFPRVKIPLPPVKIPFPRVKIPLPPVKFPLPPVKFPLPPDKFPLPCPIPLPDITFPQKGNTDNCVVM